MPKEPEFEHYRDDEIPTLSEVKSAFEHLHQLIKSKASIEEVKKCLEEMPLSRMNIIRAGIKPPERIYRARRLEWNEDVTNPATFSYPPSHLARLGRANRPGRSVFYGALDPDTAIKEYLHAQHAEDSCTHIYVSQWRLKEKFNSKQILHSNDFLKDELLASFNRDAAAKLRRTIATYSEEKQKALFYAAEKMGEYFLDEDHEISSLIAEMAFDDFRDAGKYRIHALIYPSVVKDHRNVSLAFEKEFADEHLELVEIRRLQLGQMDVSGSYALWLSLGLPKNGRIQWYQPLFGPHRVKRHSIQMNGLPEDLLEYKSPTVTIAGNPTLIEDLAAKIIEQKKDEMVQFIYNEISNSPFTESPRLSQFRYWVEDRPLEYEGRMLDRICVTLTMEHTIGIEEDLV